MRKGLISSILAAVLYAVILPSAIAQDKPVIGISTSFSSSGTMSVGNSYVNSVINGGGIPYILPLTHDAEIAETILNMVDGLILTGGEDIDPAYFGEEILQNGTVSINGPRDTSDVLYTSIAVRKGMPILAICRGEQLANVVLGGSLYQDLPSQYPGILPHSQKEARTVPTQTVTFEKGSYIGKLLQVDTLGVNSFHHQAVKAPAPGIKVVGRTPDGNVEAYEGLPEINIIATQFHPEAFAMYGHPVFLRFFTDLTERALAYRSSNKTNNTSSWNSRKRSKRTSSPQ